MPKFPFPHSLARLAVAISVALAASAAAAQQSTTAGKAGSKGKADAKKPAPAPANEQNGLVLKAMPLLPTEPIAIVNGESITRERLANECVARHGKEVLDTIIARTLIEQALRNKKIEVTTAEVNSEIDHTATQVAKTDRETWLRSIEKEKGISPSQYARDIVWPSLALKKLSANRVQVTEADIKDAFESTFGEKLRIRMISVQKQRDAVEIWGRLQTNPNSFEYEAKQHSVDINTRAMGGLYPDPLGRHDSPRQLSDSAFAQLVDGDPADKNPAHKPKDGDITGPIQVAQDFWVIIKREELLPGDKSQSLTDKKLRDELKKLMFEEKLKKAMADVYNELQDAAGIENILTGVTKPPQAVVNAVPVDEKVKLMSNPDAANPAKPEKGKAVSGALPKKVTPPGAPVDDVKGIE